MHNLFFIKHKQYRDICWRVLATYGGTGYTKYKAECWNLGFDASWPIDVKDYVEIKNEDKENWLMTKDTSNKCLRYAKWEELTP